MRNLFALIVLFPVIALAEEVINVVQPEQIEEALKLIPVLIEFMKNGQWLLAGAMLSMLITFALRKYALPKMKLGTGVLPLVSAIVGCIAGVSLAIVNGATPLQSTLAVMSGPAASLLWDSAVKYLVKK